MARKKSNGEGSIFPRKKDGKIINYCGCITIGTDVVTGKLKRKYFYGKTKDDVIKKMVDAQSKLFNGSYVEPTKLTLEEWLDIWLNTYKKNPIRPRTYENYEYLIRVHIKPNLGKIQLKNLNSEMIQDFYNLLSKSGRVDGKGGLAPKTIGNIHTLLREVLEKAVQTKKIYSNVSTNTNLPKKRPNKVNVLTKEEQITFMRVAKSHRLGVAFILLLATGLRVGELLGLRWEDIDLENNLLYVNQIMGRIKSFDDVVTIKSKLAFGDPKTAAGKRIIPVPLPVIQMIKQHKKLQLEKKIEFNGDFNKLNLVFCSTKGTPIDLNNLDRIFKALLKKSGLQRNNLHALRHTYATTLLEENEHPKTVQELLGHSTISTTLDIYSHVSTAIKEKAAQKIEYIFKLDNDSKLKEVRAYYHAPHNH